MVLYYVITIVNRNKSAAVTDLYRECGLTLSHTQLGSGTATSAILSANGLATREKAAIGGIAGPDSLRQLMHQVKAKLYLDIPGNGIMMSIPIKSVGGRKNMAMIAENTTPGAAVPDMHFDHELIVVILNEGQSDAVMDAARSAGATGGTIIHAKGSGAVGAKPFHAVSLADEKDVIYIVARSEAKADIMRAINAMAGRDTPVGAICFSLPISSVVGLRTPDPENGEE